MFNRRHQAVMLAPWGTCSEADKTRLLNLIYYLYDKNVDVKLMTLVFDKSGTYEITDLCRTLWDMFTVGPSFRPSPLKGTYAVWGPRL